MSGFADEDALAEATADANEADARDAFRVDLEGYEGPLHLLLDLARRHKVDLAHISILKLADQYLSFIREAELRRIDLAADYLLMAAWLAFLKSKLLLPSDKPAEDEVSGDELAGRLAFRLKRLDAMRRASEALFNGHVDGRDVFRRGDPEFPRIVRKPLWTTTLHDLLKGFGDINSRKAKRRAHVVKRQPVLGLEQARDHLVGMAHELTEWRSVQTIRATGDELGEAPRRSEVASFFSAALELTRDRALDLRQDKAFSDVYVRKARPGAIRAAE